MAELIGNVEKILDFMKSLNLTQDEAIPIASYVLKTLEYNGIKDSIKDDIKAEIIEELNQIKKEK